MAEGTDLKRRITDIATCPICREDFKNSRMLPCVHSFCFECLRGHCKDKMAGDYVACPVCRSKFQIPAAGLQGLPRNFFVQNLIDARDASNQKTDVLCEICAADNDGHGGEIPSAAMYCVDCSQKLCKPCSRPHKMWRGGPHQVRTLGAELTAELIHSRASFCDQHKDERLKLYCHDCEVNVCLMCFAVDHSGHKCADVGKVADEFIKSFDADIGSMSSRIDDFRAAVTQVDAENTKFLCAVRESGTSVQKRAETVNKHVTRLMQELETVKSDGEKEASNRKEELNLAITSLDSFKVYLAELMAKGSPCDVTRAAKAMRSRANELLQTCVIPSDYCAPRVTFTPMNLDELTNEGQNLIGRISLQTDLEGKTSDVQGCEEEPRTDVVTAGVSGRPAMTHAIPGSSGVYGIASIGEFVYVVRNYEKRLNVYEAATMRFHRRISLNGLSHSASSLAACPKHNCLYFGDWNDLTVHRVDLANTKLVKKWEVAEKPEGLSVNKAHNVLVACLTDSVVEEYTTNGRLVRQIRLRDDAKPWHAVQLSTGDYVVSQCKTLGVVTIVGQDGRTVRSYTRTWRSGCGLKCPRGIAVTQRGDILVADTFNNRILKLNSSLTDVEELELSGAGMLREPCVLCLDETRDRLYVGEIRDRSRLIVFNYPKQ